MYEYAFFFFSPILKDSSVQELISESCLKWDILKLSFNNSLLF